jgi:hypothetical protein
MSRDGIKRIQELMEVSNPNILSEGLYNNPIPKNMCVDIIQFLIENENDVFIELIVNLENNYNVDVSYDDGKKFLQMLGNTSKLFGEKYDDLGYLDYFVAFSEKNISLIRQNVFDENLYVSPTLRTYEIIIQETYTARHTTKRKILEKYYSGNYLIDASFLYLHYNYGDFDPYEGDEIGDDMELIQNDGWEVEDIYEMKNKSTNEIVLSDKKTLLKEISFTSDIHTLLELQNAVKQRLMKFGL